MRIASRSISTAASCAIIALACAAAGSASNARAGTAEPLEWTLPYVAPTASSAALYPLNVPGYDSLPGAHAKLYLNFTGETNYDWGGFVPGVTPAYDTDGDPTTFSQVELNGIHEIWQRVAEKYSPFNVDVTTVDPGNLNRLETQKIVIGGDGKNGQPTYWAGDRYGGISFVSSFSSYDSTTAPRISYVFSGNLTNGDPKVVAEASAHEAGHAFGLLHQSVWDPTTHMKTAEYNPGTAEKAPIMGKSYSAQRGLWWYGPDSLFYNQFQYDPGLIAGSANEFGSRPDDHGNDAAHADPLTTSGSSASAAGVIETFVDRDYFSFTSTGGLAQFTVDPFSPGGMLDASLALYSADGTLITAAQTASLSESLSAMLAPGAYDLVVSGAGDYGDLGQYTISGTTIPEPASAVALLTLLLARRRPQRRLY